MNTYETNLPFRQIHLDFHNSKHIPKIGADFDAGQFKAMLQLGHVDAINLFSKCIHGWSYHPTEVGKMHPELSFNLFDAQLKACREIDIQATAYICAGFDEYYLSEVAPGDVSFPPEGYQPQNIGIKRICFNTPYLDYFAKQVEELITSYEIDGIWLDITGVTPCVCKRCQMEMFRRDLDPRQPEHVRQLAGEVQLRYFNRINAVIAKHRPDIRIFHNAGHIPKGGHVALDASTRVEIESLPTGGWGYDHFPLSAKYAVPLGKEVIGMTGKFHTTWGEFGGFKPTNALRYETSCMLAYGTRCAIGDQLHPRGAMNAETYRRIGLAYQEVEAKEVYCVDAKPIAEIAMLSIESMHPGSVAHAHIADRDVRADTGCGRVLLESQIMFDVIDTEADFNAYKLIVLPDEARLNDTLASKLKAYLTTGGKLLLSGESGLHLNEDHFCFDVGTPAGWSSRPEDSDENMEYIQLTPEFLAQANNPVFVESPVVVTGNNLQVTPPAGATILGSIHKPYFNRTLAHFCSHQHAPDNGPSGFPAAFIHGNILYFGTKIFTDYANRGQVICREFVSHAIRQFLDQGQVRTSLPSAGRISLMQQTAENRYIFHALYASPTLRGDAVFPEWKIKKIEVLEDIVPVYDVACSLRLSQPIQSVKLVPSGTKLAFTQNDDRIEFTIPKIDCHQMVALNY